MTDPTALEALAAHNTVRLTTFRRDGTPVPTPVWLVRDGDALLVTTGAAAGKVKRIRHTPRVLLAPCDQRGRVKDGVPDVEGYAALVEDAEQLARLGRLLKQKYGFFYTVAMLVNRLSGRRSADDGIIVKITAAGG